MKRTLLIAAAALLLSGPAAAQTYTAYGWGMDSCGRWTSARADPDTWPANAAAQWLAGFLSGYNAMLGSLSGQSVNHNVAASTDMYGAAAWLDNYCRENPTIEVGVAAVDLVNHLNPR